MRLLNVAAEARFGEFCECWEAKYPAMISMWRSSWRESIPLLDFPVVIRKMIYATNGIESLNARFRASIRRRGHFPNEQAAMKILYMTIMERRTKRPNAHGQVDGWKSILNTLALTYGDRLGIN